MRIYPLLVLKGTPLEALWRQGRYRPLTLAEAVRRTAELLNFLKQGASLLFGPACTTGRS